MKASLKPSQSTAEVAEVVSDSKTTTDVYTNKSIRCVPAE